MSDARPQHSVQSTNLAELLERVLDRGIVIAGDIKVKLLDIELLTIQLRLVICSVDKAKEIGLDWWNQRALAWREDEREANSRTQLLEERLARLESQLAKQDT
jgi:hypothetical protein